MLWYFIAIPVGIYLILGLFLCLRQRSFVYSPSTNLKETPESIGLEYEDISFQAEDGAELNGWYIPSENAEHTILFCHGNAGNMSHRLDTIHMYRKMGFNFFLFDYRGFGKSKGVLSEEGTYMDAEAAWKFLLEEKKVSEEKIIIIGRSLGGAIAAWLANKYKPAGFILESAFMSITEVGRDRFPIFPAKLLAKIKYETAKYVSVLNCPKLIVHSPADEIIPFRHGQGLFEHAAAPKEFLKLDGSHNDCYFVSEDLYSHTIKRFISTLSATK